MICVVVVEGRRALGEQLVLFSGAAAQAQSGRVVVFVVVDVVGVEQVDGRACLRCATRPAEPPWSFCSGGCCRSGGGGGCCRRVYAYIYVLLCGAMRI